MHLDNNFKIRFCNAISKLESHRKGCVECSDYLSSGNGDLCLIGKEVIQFEMFPHGTLYSDNHYASNY